jgi:glycosyltransferase involved in cell wall biosynthesis
MPSRYESFGLAAVEALACACPIVGYRECLQPLGIAIDGSNAVLVDGVGDRVTSLAEGLRTLMQDSALRRRLGQAGPASVQCFAREAVVDQWESFLYSCLGTP